MFPLRDSLSPDKFPLITVLLIAANVVVFIFELTTGDPEAFISTYALIPEKVLWSNFLTLTPFITSQFLHAGFLHVIGNMWFLKIFGDNVEEKFGYIKYLLIYLLSGIVGGLTQYLFTPTSDIPMLGASGAVAGILGAYLVFFPKHRIKTLVPYFGFFSVVRIPASIMLVYWFLIQLFSGVGSIAVAQVGGVAFWAHLGGFATGYIIAKLSQRSLPSFSAEEGEALD